MRKSAILLFLVLVALAGCCSPDSCRPARLGVRQLEPIIERIESYQQTEGRFPDKLEDAFPGGMPSGLTRVSDLPSDSDLYNTDGAYRSPLSGKESFVYALSSDKGRVIFFAFGALSKSPFVTTAESVDGALKAHRYITFGYTGPGQNDCVWTTIELSWNCSGYM